MAENKDISLYKLPPHSKEAEESVLSAILNDSQTLLSVAEILSPEDFYHDSHARVFAAMVDLFNDSKPVDITTLADILSRKKDLEAVGGHAYLARLMDQVPLAVNAPYYAEIIREKAILRRLIQQCGEITKACYEAAGEVGEIMDFAESAVFSVTEKKSREAIHPLPGLIEKSLETLGQRSKNRALVTGVPTGFVDLDRLTSGLQPSDLVILAARPGMGKTALAL
ncbi:MAG: replicative DNA helicase, partial [Deltaproteobacteria bacterium]|nr:replicative DNA helicase [Deltaproteobacteria bacterium]